MKVSILFISISFIINAYCSFTSFKYDNLKELSNNTLKKDAKKLAEYYRQRVLRGESMASIATLYSEDTGSAPNGGQYKNVIKGMMVPEFEKVAFSLKPNEISEVFETQYGFHFIQLLSRKGDVLDLRHLLIMK